MLGYAKLILSGSTTAGGYCDVPESVFNDEYYGISITPAAPNQNPGDWFYDRFTSAGGHSLDRKYILPIKGEEHLHLVKTNDFPTGYYIEFIGQGEQSYFSELIARVYGFPPDTSFFDRNIQGTTKFDKLEYI